MASVGSLSHAFGDHSAHASSLHLPKHRGHLEWVSWLVFSGEPWSGGADPVHDGPQVAIEAGYNSNGTHSAYVYFRFDRAALERENQLPTDLDTGFDITRLLEGRPLTWQSVRELGNHRKIGGWENAVRTAFNDRMYVTLMRGYGSARIPSGRTVRTRFVCKPLPPAAQPTPLAPQATTGAASSGVATPRSTYSEASFHTATSAASNGAGTAADSSNPSPTGSSTPPSRTSPQPVVAPALYKRLADAVATARDLAEQLREQAPSEPKPQPADPSAFGSKQLQPDVANDHALGRAASTWAELADRLEQRSQRLARHARPNLSRTNAKRCQREAALLGEIVAMLPDCVAIRERACEARRNYSQQRGASSSPAAAASTAPRPQLLEVTHAESQACVVEATLKAILYNTSTGALRDQRTKAKREFRKLKRALNQRAKGEDFLPDFHNEQSGALAQHIRRVEKLALWLPEGLGEQLVAAIPALPNEGPLIPNQMATTRWDFDLFFLNVFNPLYQAVRREGLTRAVFRQVVHQALQPVAWEDALRANAHTAWEDWDSNPETVAERVAAMEAARRSTAERWREALIALVDRAHQQVIDLLPRLRAVGFQPAPPLISDIRNLIAGRTAWLERLPEGTDPIAEGQELEGLQQLMKTQETLERHIQTLHACIDLATKDYRPAPGGGLGGGLSEGGQAASSAPTTP